MTTPRFGIRRLVHPDAGRAERWLFRAMGVADPAHFLHHVYLKRALARFDLRAPQSILDAGCGRGDHTFFLAQRYPSATVIGLDVDESRIAMNKVIATRLGLTNVSFEVHDLRALPWKDRFDLIVSIDVLEHIVEQDAVLRTLRDALRSGGNFFFHIPTARHRPVPFSRWLKGLHEWAEKEHTAPERTHDEFVSIVRTSGFEVTTVERTFGYFTGELATSLFSLPFENTTRNKVIQALMAPLLRPLTLADPLGADRERYAVAVSGNKR